MRGAAFVVPPWTNDPFEQASDEGEALTLKNGRYLVQEVFRFTNIGGVYLALDQEANQQVVIKEARPHTSFDQGERDAVALRHQEWRLLKHLNDTGMVPNPLDLFQDWEHTFLVESFVEGSTVWDIVAEHSAFYDATASDSELREYIGLVLRVGSKIADALGAIHERGVVVGDISHTNVLVDVETLAVRFVDLEGAVEVGVDESMPIWTPGYAIERQRSQRPTTPTFEDDYYGLGSLLITFLHPIQTLRSVNPDAHSVFLKELTRDFNLPSALVSTIMELSDEDETKRPAPAIVSQRLRSSTPQQVKRTIANRRMDKQELEKLVQGISAFVKSTADYDRNDRLFPSSVSMRNPLGIAHGALGIAHFLQKVDGEVPADVWTWIDAQVARRQDDPPGLYAGLSGMAWVLGELGKQDHAAELLQRAIAHPQLFEESDLYSGVAGVGTACIHRWMQTGESETLRWAEWIADWLVHSVQVDKGYHWQSSEQPRVIGYAHGSSGISLFFLYLHLATDEKEFLEIGRKALQHDLRHQKHAGTGNYASFPRFENETALHPYWCFGTAGVGTALIRFFTITHDNSLRMALDRILPDVDRKYTVLPGLFNGLAGLGNFLMDCYQLDGESPEVLNKIDQVIQGITLFRVEKPSGIAFPSDHLLRLSADYATGSSGVGLFLHRVLTDSENFNFLLDDLIQSRQQQYLVHPVT